MQSRWYRPKRGNDAFTDLLFNTLLGFAFMFVIAFMLIADTQSEGNIDHKAEFIITVSWPDHHPDDVDVLVEDPRGHVLWFDNRDTGVMHLDRDDRGRYQDQLEINGKLVSNPINQETVSLRSWVPGEYVVNVLHYKANFAEPLAVSVKLEKLNPEVTLLYYGVHELTRTGHEVTATRFTLDADGNTVATSALAKSLLTLVNKKAKAG